MTTVETKRCSKCGREYPMYAFGQRRRTADGREARCKNCTNRYRRRYRQQGEEGEPRVVVRPRVESDDRSTAEALERIREQTAAVRPWWGRS